MKKQPQCQNLICTYFQKCQSRLNAAVDWHFWKTQTVYKSVNYFIFLKSLTRCLPCCFGLTSALTKNRRAEAWTQCSTFHIKGSQDFVPPRPFYWLIFSNFVDSVECELSETDKTIHSNPCAYCPPPNHPPYFSCSLSEYVQSCIELWRGAGGGWHTDTAPSTASVKKPGGERLLIVSPFHRLQAVRALCGSGSRWRTRALVHEKIQCIKQLGLEGKAARGYKLLFYVLLTLSLCTSYSLCHSCLFITHSPPSPRLRSPSPRRLLLGQVNNVLSLLRFFNLAILLRDGVSTVVTQQNG